MLLRHIRYLLALAEHRNFTRAAEALHVSQPALSQQIRQIEDGFATPLFDRTGRTVELTDAGRVYVDYARRALRELDAGQRAIHDVRDLSRGSLRLATTPTFTEYLIAPLVEQFGARHPGISVSIEEMTLDQIVLALGDDRIDVGIGFTNVGASSEVVFEPLFDERLTVVVGEAHPQAQASGPLSLSDLATMPLALLSSGFATRTLIDAYFQRHRITPNIKIEANSISSLVKIVRFGRVASILPDAIVQAGEQFQSVALEPALPTRTVAMLSRREAYRSAAAGAFRDLLSEYVAERVQHEP